ncbi:hypothetical protein PBRA_007161 [Plasmodiophora brassicae]|uniref:Uncharacterized protein n=1 Tax=Plasmodiophora brassicae TaxID=37360 RepID=A0A0G4IUW9_PLABS|nr:hypothetical protein PBRA_007161 [Plasmodiophora brassicae]
MLSDRCAPVDGIQRYCSADGYCGTSFARAQAAGRYVYADTDTPCADHDDPDRACALIFPAATCNRETLLCEVAGILPESLTGYVPPPPPTDAPETADMSEDTSSPPADPATVPGTAEPGTGGQDAPLRCGPFFDMKGCPDGLYCGTKGACGPDFKSEQDEGVYEYAKMLAGTYALDICRYAPDPDAYCARFAQGAICRLTDGACQVSSVDATLFR